jgi:hypothetical protein
VTWDLKKTLRRIQGAFELDELIHKNIYFMVSDRLQMKMTPGLGMRKVE